MSHGETSTDTASFLAFHLLGAAVSDEGICIYNSEAGGVLIAAAAVLVLSTALFHGKSTPTTPKPVPTSNMRVPQNQAVEEMNTLRFFPNQTDNNCYVIPLKFPGFNHIVRAGFYYGNYDGLSKTPTFDLKIDRENWTTVNTSSSVDGGLPIYHEAIYLTRSGNLTVCLVQTRDGELPFISSLEGVPIRNIYEEVLETTTATLHLVARSQEPTLVALKSVNDEPISKLLDYVESMNVSDPIILTIDLPPLQSTSLPAYFVFYFAAFSRNYIESVNVSYPITLDVNLPLQYSTPLPAYFVFYFADLTSTRDRDDIRTMQIYINGQEKTTITLQAVPSGLDRNGPGPEWPPQDSNSWWQQDSYPLFSDGTRRATHWGFELGTLTQTVALLVPSGLLAQMVLGGQCLGVKALPPSLMTSWWSIDCGDSNSHSISWEIDTNYTKAGSNMRVPQNQALDEMNTPRFFPNQTDNNRYVIPLKFPGFNHIVRAGFYYGNYDSLSKPPTFDLKLDREIWTTVNTSSSVDGGLPIYHEAIYLTRSGNLTVCLVQTMDREVPFISSLEGVPIRNIYEEVLDTTTATLHLVARSLEPTLVALKSSEFLSFNLIILNCMVQNLGRDQYDSTESYPPRPWPVPNRYPSWSRNCGEDQMRGSKPTKVKNTELEPCILESPVRSKKHACLFGSPKFLPEMELSDMRSRVAGPRHRRYHRRS
ncbi:putative LRR receptor-like serine/threonine-protein kinase MEE39 [Vitis vinifera]|uniref:Putative LRR receptor-like serine/threonine-protein kinase MEE39 n=1 Tax=Vitis vinifera TaxID=29760 RepID=A0A438ENT2_VITVI|nr:putative LRR receptor-like serine/threonine-protein kinase MEE39 [Vitis vinifera]